MATHDKKLTGSQAHQGVRGSSSGSTPDVASKGTDSATQKGADEQPRSKTMRTYEVNADENRTFKSQNARDVAEVAVAWKKQGKNPQAYAVSNDHGLRMARVPITTVKITARSLASAER